MNDLASHVEESIRAKRLFRDGQAILLAVSGGVDSMAMLRLLHQFSKTRRWKLAVAHFNHQLRGRHSDADERLARKTARQLKLPFISERGDVRQFAKEHGLSLEMAARQLRHDFLARTASRLGIPTVALAHHADDQVELFFLRLFRGSGGDGLAGMKWSSPSPSNRKIQLVRPILDVTKAAIEAFAREQKIPFSHDASNNSIDIQRNRIRHELIPLLTRHYQPALGANILRLMEIVGAEAEFVTSIAREWLKGGRTPKFHRLLVAMQRRVIQHQIIEAGLTPDFDLIERLRLKSGQWFAVRADSSVSRDAGGVIHWRHLEPALFKADRREFPLATRKCAVAFNGVKINCEIVNDTGTITAKKQVNVEYFDADKVGAPICLRCWQPGDRFQPIGTGSARKLQDLFTNLKVPANERRRRVVAATRFGEIFWVEGLRMAEKFKLDEKTVRKLKWSWRRIVGRALS